MNKDDIQELTKLCSPVVLFMKRKCSPHETLIITGEYFKIVADEICIPIKESE